MMTKRKINMKRAIDEADVSVNELLDLSSDEDMQVIKSVKTSQGLLVDKMQETFKGIPVFDSSVAVEMTQDGRLSGDASGTFVQNIEDDVTSTKTELTIQDALRIAVNTDGDDAVLPAMDDVVYSKQIYLDTNDKARLVYYIKYSVKQKRPGFIIDAMSGEILLRWNSLETHRCDNRITGIGGNVKMGKITYGKEPYCLDMKIEGDICYLENRHVRLVDMMNTENSTINETASFVCAEGYNDTVNGAYSPAFDVFFYGTLFGKMFDDWFKTAPLTEKIVLRAHYGKNFANARWNGKNCTFGDGDEYIYPVVTADMVCHEAGHGVTEQSSDLLYFGQSGGINEAFSDIMGEACEYYLGSNDYLVGVEILKPEVLEYFKSLREFEHPTRDGDSIEHVRDFTEGLDPHDASGVFRRMFYVLTKQKEVSFKKTAEVFYHANTIYWHHLSSYEDAACSILKSAYDLGQKPTAYRRAFEDVGITPCDLTQHVRSLVQNRTYSHITVSDESHPLFAFECPSWAERAFIAAQSAHSDVGITYQNGTWDTMLNQMDEDDNSAEFVNYVEIPNINDNVLFITLSSPSGVNMDDVSLTAGYFCNTSFNSSDTNVMFWYRYHCGLSE